MKFGEFFDLVRQHGEIEQETERIDHLTAVNWSALPTRWVVMALEHFAVMIHEWNKQNPDKKSDFWIEMKGRAYAALMSRVVANDKARTYDDEYDCAAQPEDGRMVSWRTPGARAPTRV